MKAVAVGDLLIPPSIMAKAFEVEELKNLVTEVFTLEFKSESRNDLRNKWRKIESLGPKAEMPPIELNVLIKDVDVLAVHICPISSDLIKKANKLKVIGTARGGLENIDINAATERKIPIINTPNHNAHAVAEYTIGLMLAETRNIARSHKALKDGIWREYYPNTELIPELNGSTIGLIGFGKIGQLVAKKLQSFEVKILVYDPYQKEEIIEKAGCVKVDLKTLLKESDIVSLHVRLTSETKGMIGEKEFRLMKSSAYFINTARAGLIDAKAMQRALEEGWITGAAIDVFETEPIPVSHPLLRLDNITLTSHRAGDTHNAYWKAPLLLGKQINKLLTGEIPDYIVNPEVLQSR